MQKAHILVVDDHLQILDAIRNLLKPHPEIADMDLFHDGQTACEHLSRKRYELCIVDLRLPRMDGFAVIGQIRKVHPAAKIIINTMCDELWDAKRIMELNVEGIVMKTSSLLHLQEAVDSVLAGKKYYCSGFRQLERQQKSGANIQLSEREIEVLQAIADGCTTEEISQRHNISNNTIESIRKRLLLKMDARNMAQLVAQAYQTGLITNYCTHQ